jgi:hypothetical protein
MNLSLIIFIELFPLQFEITFDCMENLEDDLEWKLTYVGSAESASYDQVIFFFPTPPFSDICSSKTLKEASEGIH